MCKYANTPLELRMLLDGVTDAAVILLDPGGIVGSWNAGAERLHGHSGAEIIGQHVSVLYPPTSIDGGGVRWLHSETDRHAAAAAVHRQNLRQGSRQSCGRWPDVMLT